MEVSSARAASTSFPDLSCCTRVEIRYSPSAFEYVGGDHFADGLLNAEERIYLQADEKIVVEDAEYIRALGQTLAAAIYSGPAEGTYRTRQSVRFACYHGDERLGCFTLLGETLILTEDEKRFTCPKVSSDSESLRPPQIRSLVGRIACAKHLDKLYDVRRLFGLTGGPYPAPTKWCDELIRAQERAGYRKRDMQECFMCPAMSQGRCHYAMNPNCAWNSPFDTVLLFETKAGWNQHGGPELFTFDNHNPKGGCVLLNDGTVRFIRTEEELRALRWR